MNREKLINVGVDYDEGVDRFGGQPLLFEKYLIKFFAGHLMADLEEQLAARNFTAAFRTSHDLKGAAGNLSLNLLFAKICVLTELLRQGNPQDEYMSAFTQAQKLYDATKQAMEE